MSDVGMKEDVKYGAKQDSRYIPRKSDPGIDCEKRQQEKWVVESFHATVS
jgi:hypothetical protein